MKIALSTSLPAVFTALTLAAAGILPAQELRPNEDARTIAAVRALYDEVEDANLATSRKEIESEDGLQIIIERSSDQTGVRRIALDVVAGDHGGFNISIYYYKDSNMPGFVLWKDSYWRFDADNPDRTIDFFSEYRFYYSDDGDLARQLIKAYQGSTEPEIDRNAAQAVNKPLTTHPGYAFEFWKNLANLAITEDEFVGRRVEDLLDAFHAMRE